MAKETGEPSWTWRRALIFTVTAFCCVLLWRMLNAPDTGVNQTIATGLLFLIGIIVLLYTGFATVQDVVAIWKTGSALPYAKPKDGDP